jgi:hypothetical protein
MPKMPFIPSEALSAVESNAATCVSRRVFHPTTRRLKAKKPYPKMDFAHVDALLHASANYVWRVLAFDLCDFAPFNCMPCTADWDLRKCFSYQEVYAEREAWRATLDEAIKQIESAIPADQHYGAIRWGRALDLLKPTNSKEQSA